MAEAIEIHDHRMMDGITMVGNNPCKTKILITTTKRATITPGSMVTTMEAQEVMAVTDTTMTTKEVKDGMAITGDSIEEGILEEEGVDSGGLKEIDNQESAFCVALQIIS